MRVEPQSELSLNVVVWIFIALYVVMFLGMLMALRSQHRRDVVALRFFTAVGLPAGDDQVVGAVKRRVVAIARGQLVGGFLGILVTATLFFVNPSWVSVATFLLLAFPLIIGGMTVGAGIVTVRDTLFQKQSSATRVARSMTPGLADYVNARRRITTVVLLGMAVAILVVGAVLTATGLIPTAILFGSVAMPAIVVAAVGAAIFRVLCRRVLELPQPASTEVELAWDDALKGTTLLNLVQLGSFLAWIAVAAATQMLLSAVDAASGTNWAVGLGSQLFTWGVLALTLDSVIGAPKRYFRRRLWPELPAAPEQVANAAP